MQHSSITLEVYFRKLWKLLLQRLHHSNDIRVKTYVRIILGHPTHTSWITTPQALYGPRPYHDQFEQNALYVRLMHRW